MISGTATDGVEVVVLETELWLQEQPVWGNKSIPTDLLKKTIEAKAPVYTLEGLAKKNKQRSSSHTPIGMEEFSLTAYWKEL